MQQATHPRTHPPSVAAGAQRSRTILHQSCAPQTHDDDAPIWRSGRRVVPSKEYVTMDWRHRAACLEEDPELFFAIGNTGPALLQIEEAKAVCRRCDVVDPCLKWAIESGQDAGVWGGMSEDERRALKRRTARARRAG